MLLVKIEFSTSYIYLFLGPNSNPGILLQGYLFVLYYLSVYNTNETLNIIFY